MTLDYVQATINTLDELKGTTKTYQFVLDQIKELTLNNLQGLDVKPRRTNAHVDLLYNGVCFAENIYTEAWMLEGNCVSLEVPLEVKEAYEKYTKEKEFLDTLQTILVSCYKDEVVKQFPATKQLFAKTDERIKAKEQQILDDWKALKEDLEAFYN